MQRTSSAEATRLMSQTSGPIAPLRAPVEKRFAGNRPPDNTEQVAPKRTIRANPRLIRRKAIERYSGKR